MTNTAATLSYVGWLKRGTGRRRWEPVCSASTEQATWAALLDTPRVGSCDLVVLKQGERPEKYQRERVKR